MDFQVAIKGSDKHLNTQRATSKPLTVGFRAVSLNVYLMANAKQNKCDFCERLNIKTIKIRRFDVDVNNVFVFIRALI